MTRWMVGVCAVLVSGCMTGDSSIGEPVEADGGGSTSGGTGQDAADGVSATSSQQMDDDSSGVSGAVDDDGSEGTSGAPQFACPEYSPCTFALECDEDGSDCGGILSRSDANGCPRPFCESDEECPDDHRCVLPQSWGFCGHDPCGDDPVTGMCDCPFVGLDCPSIGSCVSEDTVPPPEPTGHDYCGLYTDEGSCLAAPTVLIGQSFERQCRWYEGYEMDVGDLCSERVPIERCVYTSEYSERGACENDETLAPMLAPNPDQPDRVTVLLVDDGHWPMYDEPYNQWGNCALLDSAECDCACP